MNALPSQSEARSNVETSMKPLRGKNVMNYGQASGDVSQVLG
jgi:hypothetical protein